MATVAVITAAAVSHGGVVGGGVTVALFSVASGACAFCYSSSNP